MNYPPPPREPEPDWVEMPAEAMPADLGNLWDQLQGLSSDQPVSLLIYFADIEDEDGGEYLSDPYGGR